MRNTYSWCVMCECVKKIRQIWHIQFVCFDVSIYRPIGEPDVTNERMTHLLKLDIFFSYTRCANYDAWRITNTNHTSCGPSLTGLKLSSFALIFWWGWKLECGGTLIYSKQFFAAIFTKKSTNVSVSVSNQREEHARWRVGSVPVLSFNNLLLYNHNGACTTALVLP